MLGGIWRLIKAIGLFLTFRFDKAAKTLMSSPEGVTASFEEVIRSKTGKINTFKSAVAQMRKENEKRKGREKTLKDEVEQLKKRRTGAQNKAQAKIKQLVAGGKTVEEAKLDTEVQECLKWFQDFSSTLTAKEETLVTLTAQIIATDKQIESHLTDGRRLVQEIENLKTEKGDAVARLVSAQAMREANEAMAGISQDNTSELLANARDAVQTAEAEAKVTEDITGLTGQRQMAEFDALAEAGTAETDFFATMDLGPKAKTTAAAEPSPVEKAAAVSNGAAPKTTESSPLPE